MILRRVVEQLKLQHWRGAFIELAIVVVGVFVGIQASNWNAAQADRRKGEEYATRLLQDLRDDLLGRERMVSYYRAVQESAENTVALLRSPAPDPKALVVNAYRASEMNFYTTMRATWGELVSSGELGILPPRLDQRDISTFFTFDAGEDIKQRIQNSPYRRRVRRMLPHALQEAIRAGCSDEMDELGNVISFKPECRLDISDAEVAAAAAALREDPGVLADLRLHFSTLVNAISSLDGDVVLLKRAMASFDDTSDPRRDRRAQATRDRAEGKP